MKNQTKTKPNDISEQYAAKPEKCKRQNPEKALFSLYGSHAGGFFFFSNPDCA